MNELEVLAERLENAEARNSEPDLIDVGDSIKLTYNPDYRRLAEFIGVDVADMNDNAEGLEFLMEWGKAKSKSENVTDSMYEIKKLRDKLGFQEIGATALKKLKQHIRLTDEQNTLFDRLDKIKKEKELI